MNSKQQTRYQVVAFIGGASSPDSAYDKFQDAKTRMFEIEDDMQHAAIVADMHDGGRIVAQNAFF